MGGEGLGPGPDTRRVLALLHPESPALVLPGLSSPPTPSSSAYTSGR